MYTHKEIHKILAKASELQMSNEVNDERDGLTKEELLHVAKEAGISEEALEEALLNLESMDMDKPFKYFEGTSRLQVVQTITGDFNEDQWDEIIHEIRRVTGGIGKVQKLGRSYEWEQRRSDIGYKHFSFTPEKGATKIQMVSSWTPLKYLSGFLGFFFAFIITLITIKGLYSKELAILIAPFVGLGGLGMSRFFLKSYYEKQRKQLRELSDSISSKIKSFKRASTTSSSITIENEDVYSSDKQANETSHSRENS